MTTIPAFGASLLKNPPAQQGTAPSVEEILQNTPSAQPLEGSADSFHREGFEQAQSSGGFSFSSLIMPLLTAGGLFFMGRKGWMGKTVQTWFGGRMSLKNVHRNIESKISEYLGKNGGNVQSSQIIKNADGTKTLRANFDGGAVREFNVSEGNNIIKLSGKSPVSGQEEVIVFNRLDGSPRSRIHFVKDNDGKVLEYTSYKGGTILDAAYVDSENVFKTFSKTTPKRRFRLFGPKESKSVVTTYNNPDTGEAFVTKLKTVFKHGKRAKVKKTTADGDRTMVFDNSGKLSQIKIDPKKGNSTVLHFDYAVGPDGKSVISGVRYTDKKGNPVSHS